MLTVLAADDRIAGACNVYVDDIIVDLNKVSAEEVIEHLARFGLESKSPRPLARSTALGLRVYERDGRLWWERPDAFSTDQIHDGTTKREYFSASGKVASHMPVAGWARVAASYAKRTCEGDSWDDPVGQHTAKVMREIGKQIRVNDPCGGVWNAKAHEPLTCFAMPVGMRSRSSWFKTVTC